MPPERETPDVLILRLESHGIPAHVFDDELSRRLPDHDVYSAKTPEEERTLIEDAPVVVGKNIDESLVERAGSLELFVSRTSSTGHLPLDALREAGAAVINCAGRPWPNIAEHVVGSILLFTRRFFEGRERQRRREWRHYQVDELKGKTVTVVGQGSIGAATVERLKPFGVETIGVRYTPSKGGPADETVGPGPDEFHGALARSDILVLACPLTDETEGLVGQEEFLTLPSDALLVNVARGKIVDTEALVEAIRSNAIDGAALDVTDPEPLPEDHPLWTFDNVQITPHNAGHSPKYYERVAEFVASNVDRLEKGESLDNELV